MDKKEKVTDSVLYQHMQFDGKRRCVDWLHKARAAYDRLRPYRKERKINKDYVFGKQLDQMINVNGKMMSKRAYMEKMGLPTLSFNLLGKNMRVIQGQYRNNDVAPICHAADPRESEYADQLSELLKQNMKMNRRSEADAKNFGEFLIGGLPGVKLAHVQRRGKRDIFVDNINPNYLFFPHTTNPNFEDIPFIGLLHDMEFQQVLKMWSKSPADDDKLREIYTHCNSDDYIASMFSTDSRTYDISQTDFFTPAEYGKCRVIELWSKEYRRAYMVDDPLEPNPYYVPYKASEKAKLDAINEERRKANIKLGYDGVSPMTDAQGNIQYFQDPAVYESENLLRYSYAVEEYWYFRDMTPDGYVLEEGMSPYWNGQESMHPLVVVPYPFVDGEIHSHVETMRAAQDYMDYYVIQLDFYLRNAAKGVMMVDEESIGSMQDFEEMCDQFIRSNGVVLYTSKNGAKPPIVQTAGSIPGGFDYFINLAKTMSEDVSGAQASLQGKREAGTMSGVMTSQLINQAATSLADMMGTYNDFLEQIANKTVKFIKCCYTGTKSVSISGEPIDVSMGLICDVDCDVSISQNANTATFRALNTEFMLQLAMKQLLPLKAAVEASDIPGKDRMLKIMEKYEKMAAEQQAQMQAQQQMQVAQTA